jgi:hypothetical protein
VLGEEGGDQVGHVGEHYGEVRWLGRAAHDAAPHVQVVIMQVRRARASRPASAVIAACSSSAVARAGRHRGGEVRVAGGSR